MSLVRWQATIVDEAGSIQPSASITIRDTSGNLVSVWTDSAGTIAAGNPFTADGNGYAFGYVLSGLYSITASLGGFTITWTDASLMSSPFVFSTVAQLKEQSLPTGQTVTTQGYTTAGDGKGATYLVKTAAEASSDGDSIDGVFNLALANGNKAILQGVLIGQTTITKGRVAGNTLIRHLVEDTATRVHIEPNGNILSGTVSKLDMMFDPYDSDTDNYRINGLFLTTGDQSGNGRDAEANDTLKSVGDYYGNFPIKLWGYQDNTADRAIAMKLFYMDIAETEKPTPHKGRWVEGLSVTTGDYIQSNDVTATPNPHYGLYKATTTGTTGATQPVHTSGTASDGGVTWELVKDYYTTAASNELIAQVLFGRRGDYPVAGGHSYPVQFARGFGVHQGAEIAHFALDGSVAAKRTNVDTDLYDYYNGGVHSHKYTDTFVQHAGGGTLSSVKTVTNDDGGSGITVDARGTDTLILGHTLATSINSILCDANQAFRVRVVNDGVVTLNTGASLRMVNGTQLLGVRSVLSFYGRTANGVIEDGYVGA